jgi:hypothetical protein
MMLLPSIVRVGVLDRVVVVGVGAMAFLLLRQAEDLAGFLLDLAGKVMEWPARDVLEPLLALEGTELVDSLKETIGVVSEDCARAQFERLIVFAHRPSSVAAERLRPGFRWRPATLRRPDS